MRFTLLTLGRGREDQLSQEAGALEHRLLGHTAAHTRHSRASAPHCL